MSRQYHVLAVLQVAGVARVLAARLAIPLAVCGCVLGGMLAVTSGAAVGQATAQGIAAHLASPQALVVVATLLLAGLMPSTPEVSVLNGVMMNVGDQEILSCRF
jgi:hypothetical protein